MIQAIVFDLGNTLLRQDNLDWPKLEKAGFLNHLSIFKKRELGINLNGWSDLFYRLYEPQKKIAEKTLLEISISSIFNAMTEFYRIPKDLNLSIMVRNFFQPLINARLLFNDASAALQHLKEREIRLAVISNTHMPGILSMEVLERLNIRQYFEFAFFSSDFGWRKPHPIMFESAVNHLQLKPNQIMYVGDQPDKDVAGAGALGIKTVWINRDQIKSKKAGAKPDFTITALSELESLIKKTKR